MPHIEQPLQLIILFIKVNKYKKLIFFHLFLKSWNTRKHTHTQKLNLNQEKKMIFFATPSPSGGGGGLLQPLPPNFWNDPLEENFYHSFVALILIGELEIGLQSVKCKNVKRKNKSGGGGCNNPPPPLEGEG